MDRRWFVVLVGSLAVACAGAAGPSRSPDPTGTAGTFRLIPGPLEPGRYRADGFDVPLSFELDAGWTLRHRSARFFDLVSGDTLPAFGLPEGERSLDPCLRRLEATRLTVTEPESGDVGGLPSERVFVTQEGGSGARLYTTSEATIRMDPGHAASLTLVPVRQGFLVIGVEAPELKVESATGEADRVLATARIGRFPGG